MGIRGFAAAAAITAVALGACGDDNGKRAATAAAESLRTMTVEGPPNTQWRLADVGVVDGKIIINVALDNGSAIALKAVPRMQASQIAQRACPKATAEAWRILDSEQELWARLLDPEKHLVVETRCIRP